MPCVIFLSPCLLFMNIFWIRRSQWPRGLWRRSSAVRPLRLWVRIPPGAWIFVCYECCVLSGTGLCDGLITRPEESYRMWRVVVCDQETSRMRRLKPAMGLWKIQPHRAVTPGKQTNIYFEFDAVNTSYSLRHKAFCACIRTLSALKFP